MKSARKFLFIFLNSHQLKHHGRASSSWFFIFLLQPTKNWKHQHRKEMRKSSRTKTGELRLVEVKCPGSASRTIPTPTQTW
ncbi:hypothetical protein V6Z11_A05G064900 [Gossypium hirsutum]